MLCRNQSIDLQCKSFDWLLYGAGLCWGEEGVPEQILVVYIFVNYIFVNIFFIIGSILLSQDYRRVQMVLFYLSMLVDSVLWYARVGIQISNTRIEISKTSKIKYGKSIAISEDISVFH